MEARNSKFMMADHRMTGIPRPASRERERVRRSAYVRVPAGAHGGDGVAREVG